MDRHARGGKQSLCKLPHRVGHDAGAKAGYAVPDDAYNKALAYLRNQVAATDNADYESKAILLHALAVAGQGDFALANRLYRDRNALSSAALAHLALGFAAMDRKATAEEILGLLEKRNLDDATTRRDAAQGRAALEPFTGRAAGPLRLGDRRGLAEVGRLAQGQGTGRLADGPSHRQPLGPGKGDGPRRAGLVPLVRRQPIYRRALQADRLRERRADQGARRRSGRRQPVDRRAAKIPRGRTSESVPQHRTDSEVHPTTSSGSTSRSPAAADTPISASSAVSCRPTRSRARPAVGGSSATTSRPRWNSTAARSPRLRRVGRLVQTFRNPLDQLPVGRRGMVNIELWRQVAWGTPEQRLEYLVVTEPIPSGTTVIEKSVSGPFEHFEIGPGEITFYIGNRPGLGTIHYELYGYVPGKYRVGPTIVRNAHRPEQLLATAPKALTVLPQGAKSADPYRLTPQELYELGKRLAAKKDYVAAMTHLTELVEKWNLRPEVYKDAVQMLLDIHLEIGLAGQDRPLLRDHQGEVADRGDSLRQDREGRCGLSRDGRVRTELPGFRARSRAISPARAKWPASCNRRASCCGASRP